MTKDEKEKFILELEQKINELSSKNDTKSKEIINNSVYGKNSAVIKEILDYIEKDKENLIQYKNEVVEQLTILVNKNILTEEDLKSIKNNIDALEVFLDIKKEGWLDSFDENQRQNIDLIIDYLVDAKNINEEEAKKTSYNIRLENDKFLYLLRQLKTPYNCDQYIDVDFAFDSLATEENMFKLSEIIDECNEKIYLNLINKSNNTGTLNFNVNRQNVLIPVDELRDLFKKYGFLNNFNNLSSDLILYLQKGNKDVIAKNLSALADPANSNFSILKDFGIQTNGKSNYILMSELKKLCQIVRNADNRILYSLNMECINEKIPMNKLLRIPGIYKHGLLSGPSGPGGGDKGEGNDLDEPGNWEKYNKNKLIIEEYGNHFGTGYGKRLLKSIIDNNCELLTLPPVTLKNNLYLSIKYNIKLITLTSISQNSNTSLMVGKCKTALESSNSVRKIDRILEVEKTSNTIDLYDYVKKYRSFLAFPSDNIATFIAKTYKGEILQNKNGTVQGGAALLADMDLVRNSFDLDEVNRIASKIPKSAREEVDNASIIFDENEIKDIIKELDEKFLLTDSNLKYIVNGVPVSRNKVHRVLYTLNGINDLDVSKEDILLYAFTYNSLYNSEQLERIKNGLVKVRSI